MNCELGKYVWSLKDRGIDDFQVSWDIVATEKCFKGGTGKCQLCLREKLEIIKLSKTAKHRVINRRSELGKSCIHRFKYLLGYLKVHDTNDMELRPEEEDHNFPLNTTQVFGTNTNMPGYTRSGRTWRRNIFDNG